jgi:hypothetical protein
LQVVQAQVVINDWRKVLEALLGVEKVLRHTQDEFIALQEARCGSSTTCELDRPLERLCDRIDRVRSILAEDFERNYFQR